MIFKRLLSLSIFALFSCTVPQTRSVQRFNFEHLTQEMLDGTIWCGPLTKPASSHEKFMAVYFLRGKAGLARGNTREDAVSAVRRLNSSLFVNYHPKNQSHVSIPNFNFCDGSLGSVNVEVIFESNTKAKIDVHYDASPGVPLIYEVSYASRY